MSGKERSGLDAVDQGPLASGRTGASAAVPVADPGGRTVGHPSVEALVRRFGDAVRGHRVSAGDQHVVYVDPARNLEMLRWLRDEPEHRYDLLVDVTAVDYGKGRPIDVVYQLWSIPKRRALRVKCALPLDHLEIASVVPLWQAADWLEREVYDLFGITFTGHPDLRRILMPADYEEGHPLRKDFPLRGRFSRAEQTRRALSQDLERYYTPEVMANERWRPQELEPTGAEGTMPEREAEER